MKFIYLILSLSFVTLSSCQSDFDPAYWSKVGEIKLEGKDLKISIPAHYVSLDSLFRFYIEPNNHSSSDNYYGLMIAFDGHILHVVEKTENGGWGELLHAADDIPKGGQYFNLIIPNELLFDSDMRIWSANSEEVIVSNLTLPSKKTTKIDKNDPYIYIQIIK